MGGTITKRKSDAIWYFIFILTLQDKSETLNTLIHTLINFLMSDHINEYVSH